MINVTGTRSRTSRERIPPTIDDIPPPTRIARTETTNVSL